MPKDDEILPNKVALHFDSDQDPALKGDLLGMRVPAIEPEAA